MALIICFEIGNKAYLSCTIRIDDRIAISCCSSDSTESRLASLLATLKQVEGRKLGSERLIESWIEYVDRVWLEQRLYHIERSDRPSSFGSPREATQELFSEILTESRYTGVVILGELSSCNWIMQAAPFPWEAQMPKETEIYHLKK